MLGSTGMENIGKAPNPEAPINSGSKGWERVPVDDATLMKVLEGKDYARRVVPLQVQLPRALGSELGPLENLPFLGLLIFWYPGKILQVGFQDFAEYRKLKDLHGYCFLQPRRLSGVQGLGAKGACLI